MTNELTLAELLDAIQGYVIGGAVRDIILGREPHDYDVVTTLTPDEVCQRVKIAHAVGEKFGTVVVNTADVGPVEITTARRDCTGGRHPIVCFTDDIDEDLKRRDFTCNALMMTPISIIDHVNGIDDIDNKIIRCCGSAADRLNEDTLRALRAIRFKLQLDFDLDPELMRVLYNFDLKIGTDLAGTRVMDELRKMFAISAVKAVSQLNYYQLLHQIFPEVEILHCCLESPKWHGDERTTFIHTLRALARAQEYSFEVQIATLVHDIGKGVVRKNDSTSYHGHGFAGKLLIPRIAERLLWSNDLKALCEFVCDNHMKMHVIEQMRPFKRRQLYISPYFTALYQVHRCDAGDRMPESHYQWIIKDAIELTGAEAIITGHDIVAHGIAGKRVGELKEQCHEAQLRGDFKTRDEGIEYLRSILESD